MKRIRLIITGIVQGVGFRPFIFNIAKKFDLYGFVLNTSSGVIIEFEGAKIDKAVEYIRLNLPRGAVIENIIMEELELKGYNDFQIKESDNNSSNKISISPDIGICEDCKKELYDKKNRFYNYPFISCSGCGPRFTILEDIPYDRDSISMIDFPMCKECSSNYKEPSDRRYHAQTICCHKCGPVLMMDGAKTTIDDIAKELKDGKIIAIKGIGGYHLACDASNDEVVELLRERKNRPHKPFAVMMELKDALNNCIVSEYEKDQLQSTSAPIVLLLQKKNSAISKYINPNLNSLGVMLPYTGLHLELIRQTGPLVMTSANLNGHPIIKDEEELKGLMGIADRFVTHNRRITFRCDDSVIRCFENNSIIIRRSRGFVPSSIKISKSTPPILACGSDLKNTFCIFNNGYATPSQYIGDLMSRDNFNWYTNSIEDFKRLFNTEFKYIACDKHPAFQSKVYAKSLDKPIIEIQHHHAHIASVMAEKNIKDQVIGICFDGTGYGDDSNIWGGEVFVANDKEYKREYYFEYVDMPGNELAVNEPWRMGIGYLLNTFDIMPDIEFVKKYERDIFLYKDMISKGYKFAQTSSVGRLFDAVSAILGVREVITYEGQAAIELEAIANDYVDIYNYKIMNGVICTKDLIKGIILDIQNGVSKECISSKFHNTIAGIVLDVCSKLNAKTGIKKVVLSGGVFQNIYLLRKCYNNLVSAGLETYYNSIVPINDGGLSLGQILICIANM